MTIIYLQLKDKSKNVLLQSILGTYSHLMWVRTEDPKEMLVKVITTKDQYEESLKVLNEIKDEINFDFLDIK